MTKQETNIEYVINHLEIARKGGRVKNLLIDECIKKLKDCKEDNQIEFYSETPKQIYIATSDTLY